jgi:hypothetical protein
MERICIYPKDIQILTGKTDRYGRNLITYTFTCRVRDYSTTRRLVIVRAAV